MPTKKKMEMSRLLEAASAVDAELKCFEDTSFTLKKLPLDSQKHFENAGRKLSEVADSQSRLSEKVGELVAAIAAARQQQERQAASVQEQAEEIQRRTREYQELLIRYGGVGQEAAELRAEMARVAELSGVAGQHERTSYELRTLHDRMTAVASGAELLSKDAKEKGFDELSRQADSLGKQLIGVRGKMGELEKRVSREIVMS